MPTISAAAAKCGHGGTGFFHTVMEGVLMSSYSWGLRGRVSCICFVIVHHGSSAVGLELGGQQLLPADMIVFYCGRFLLSGLGGLCLWLSHLFSTVALDVIPESSTKGLFLHPIDDFTQYSIIRDGFMCFL